MVSKMQAYHFQYDLMTGKHLCLHITAENQVASPRDAIPSSKTYLNEKHYLN